MLWLHFYPTPSPKTRELSFPQSFQMWLSILSLLVARESRGQGIPKSLRPCDLSLILYSMEEEPPWDVIPCIRDLISNT